MNINMECSYNNNLDAANRVQNVNDPQFGDKVKKEQPKYVVLSSIRT